MKELLTRKQRGIIGTDLEGQDSPWGLEYCLDLLARSADSHDLQNYDSKKDHFIKQRVEPNTNEHKTPLSTPDKSRPSTPSQDPILESEHAIPDFETAETSPQVDTESESEFDSDWEPEEMTKKFVEWQTRRFRMVPENPEYVGKSGKLQERQNWKADTVSRRLARLDARIARMKSDILFDLDEAEQRWAAARIALAREAADRKKLGIDTMIENTVEKPAKEKPRSAMEEVGEEAMMLGELFANLPEINDVDGGNMNVTNSSGLGVAVRNFGKWKGMNPRRILEECCRARYLRLHVLQCIQY